MLDKLLSIIPEPIKQAVKKKDWNLLEKLVVEELDEDSDLICLEIAALDYWLESLKEFKICFDLSYWCWRHHEAYDITYFMMSLAPEPKRTELFRGVEDNKISDSEIYERDIYPILKIWSEKIGIILDYPVLQLHNSDENISLAESNLEDWDIFEIESNSDGSIYAAYMGRDTNNMFGIEQNSPIPLDENCLVFPQKILNFYSSFTIDFNGKKLRIY